MPRSGFGLIPSRSSTGSTAGVPSGQGAELGLQRVDAMLACVQLPAELGRAALLALQRRLRLLGRGGTDGHRDVDAPDGGPLHSRERSLPQNQDNDFAK
jgi:hypothetical protein